MRRRKRLPSYRLHKPTGQAVVTLNGKDYYLGRHGTQMSKDAYDRLTAEWLAGGRQLPAARRSMADPAVPEEIELEPRTRPAHRSGGPTINELILAWMPIQKKKVGARQLVRNHEPVLALPQDRTRSLGVVERNSFRFFPADRFARSNGTNETEKRNEFRSTKKQPRRPSPVRAQP